ncbi:MAG: hypothetical protein AAGJ35_15515, partial [Myxococcota bacterium]
IQQKLQKLPWKVHGQPFLEHLDRCTPTPQSTPFQWDPTDAQRLNAQQPFPYLRIFSSLIAPTFAQIQWPTSTHITPKEHCFATWLLTQNQLPISIQHKIAYALYQHANTTQTWNRSSAWLFLTTFPCLFADPKIPIHIRKAIATELHHHPNLPTSQDILLEWIDLPLCWNHASSTLDLAVVQGLLAFEEDPPLQALLSHLSPQEIEQGFAQTSVFCAARFLNTLLETAPEHPCTRALYDQFLTRCHTEPEAFYAAVLHLPYHVYPTLAYLFFHTKSCAELFRTRSAQDALPTRIFQRFLDTLVALASASQRIALLKDFAHDRHPQLTQLLDAFTTQFSAQQCTHLFLSLP